MQYLNDPENLIRELTMSLTRLLNETGKVDADAMASDDFEALQDVIDEAGEAEAHGLAYLCALSDRRRQNG